MAGRKRQGRVASGLCVTCGATRGVEGTSTQCRPCANNRSQQQAKRKAELEAERKAQGLCLVCGVRLASRNDPLCPTHRKKFRQRQLRYDAKTRGRISDVVSDVVSKSRSSPAS
jgi:hypothetical protein